MNLPVNTTSSNVLTIECQFNELLSIANGKPKPDDIDLNGWNTPKNWQTSTALTVPSLAGIIEKGVAIRGAIKIGGNRKGDIQSVHFLCLDFDSPDWTLSDTLASPLIKDACIWYYSPSYVKGENHKHRLVFALSRPVDVSTAELICKWHLHNAYVLADGKCIDAGRFYYGSKHKCTILSESATIDVDAAIESANHAKETLLSSTGITNTSNFTQENILNKHLFQHLFIDIFKGDCVKLYGQHFLDGVIDGTYRERALELDEIERYELRYNVFNPEKYENQQGFKALVSYTPEKLPFLLDHSERTQTVTKRTIATYLDYWLQWQSRENEKVAAKYKDCRDKFGVFHKGVFFELIKDICDYHNIPHVKPIDPLVLLAQVMDEQKKSAFIISGTEDKNIYQMKYFNYTSETDFSYVDGTSVGYIKNTLVSRIKELYPNIVEIINNDIAYKNANDGNTVKTRLIGSDNLSTWLNRESPHALIVSKLVFITDFIELPEWIAIGSNVFNVLTKETLPNTGQAKNSCKAYPNSVIPGSVSDDHPVIKVFKRFYQEWAMCEIKGEILLNYLVLTACRQSYTTRKGLVMVGRTGIGKSGYPYFLQKLINYGDVVAGYELLVVDYFYDTNNHASENTAGKFFVWVDEANHIPKKNFEVNVKKHIKGKNATQTINPKGIKGYNCKFAYGTLMTVQDILEVPTEEAVEGRLIVLDFGNESKLNENDHDYINDNLDIILSWCLNQDVAAYIKRLKELLEHDIFKQDMRDRKLDTDLVYGFLMRSLDVTYDPADKVEKKELFMAFNRYVIGEEMGKENTFTHAKGFIKALGKLLLDKVGLWDNETHNFDPNWLKKETNGKSYILGIKLKTTDEQQKIMNFVNR